MLAKWRQKKGVEGYREGIRLLRGGGMGEVIERVGSSLSNLKRGNYNPEGAREGVV